MQSMIMAELAGVHLAVSQRSKINNLWREQTEIVLVDELWLFNGVFVHVKIESLIEIRML